jgi:filamentous hemagglutinin family protein
VYNAKFNGTQLKIRKTQMKFQQLLTISLSIMTLPTQAQITTDGSVGPALNLPGPNYQIGAHFGRQHGPNLFHSFAHFNLNSHESATFSGPNTVQNFLSRVTGGNPSHIDGTIRSTIPNANLYFLNPYGIIFGPNARLDVQGSFHASTADYLRLGEDGRFDARQPSQSLLTVAPIESFGFLTNTPASIRVRNSRLQVYEGKTLSLVSGELRVEGISPHFETDRVEPSQARLLADSGPINLASVASPGKVIITGTKLSLSPETQGGDIVITNANIQNVHGNIVIRGRNVQLIHSSLNANSAYKEGGMIDIKVDNLELQSSKIVSLTSGVQKGASIFIEANTVKLITVDKLIVEGGKPISGMNSKIWASSQSLEDNAGKAGNIEIKAVQMTLVGDSVYIGNDTHGMGEGGNITLKVADTLRLSFYPHDDSVGGILISTASVDTDTITLTPGNPHRKAGNAGHINIEARQMILEGQATILSDTFGDGKAGNIILKVAETLSLSGNPGVGLSSASRGTDAKMGNAGTIVIQANKIKLINGEISTSADNAVGGNMRINTNNLLYLRNGQITTSVHGGKGDGGNITSSHPSFMVLDNGQIKAQADEGRGGNIRIVAEQFIESPDSLVSASSRLGLDGDVQIDSPAVDMDSFLVLLPGGYIDASSQLPPPCTPARLAKNLFVVKRIAGSPPSPDDFQSNRLVLLPDEEPATQKTSPRLTGVGATVGQSAPKVAFKMTRCRPDLSQAKTYKD